MHPDRQQALVELSSIGTLFNFMCKAQRLAIQELIHDDQSDENKNIAKVLAVVATIKSMPHTYQTIGHPDPMLYLRYQNSHSVIWVSEKVKDSTTSTRTVQNVAYGFADMDCKGIQHIKSDHINIKSIIDAGMWLDIEHEPVPYSTIIERGKMHMANVNHRHSVVAAA